jgi:restriction endonuclease S subunit
MLKRIKLPDLPPHLTDEDIINSFLNELDNLNTRKERKQEILEALERKGVTR